MIAQLQPSMTHLGIPRVASGMVLSRSTVHFYPTSPRSKMSITRLQSIRRRTLPGHSQPLSRSHARSAQIYLEEAALDSIQYCSPPDGLIRCGELSEEKVGISVIIEELGRLKLLMRNSHFGLPSIDSKTLRRAFWRFWKVQPAPASEK